jgi:hypothetical protein
VPGLWAPISRQRVVKHLCCGVQIPICVVCKEEGEPHHKHQTTTIRNAVAEVRAAIETHVKAASALSKEAEDASTTLAFKVAEAQNSAAQGAHKIKAQFEAARKALALREAELSKEHETQCRVRYFYTVLLCSLF